MRRKVDHLTGFIKPASPDNGILTRIMNNTNIWMMNNIKALRDHYCTLSVAIHTELGPFQPVALDKAIRWARMRYRRKLTSSSINTLYSRLLVTNSHTAAPSQTPRVLSTGPSISTSICHLPTPISIPHASTSALHTLTPLIPPPLLLTKSSPPPLLQTRPKHLAQKS